MMVRTPGWEVRLAEAMTGEIGKQYAYGTYDCETLVGRAVEAMTGVHPWPWARGYETAIQGFRLLRKNGYRTVADMMRSAAAEHGWQAIEHKFMTVGDVFSASDGRTTISGICMPSGPVSRCSLGLVYIDRASITNAWRIPWM